MKLGFCQNKCRNALKLYQQFVYGSSRPLVEGNSARWRRYRQCRIRHQDGVDIASVAYFIKMASISLVSHTSSRWRRYRQSRLRHQEGVYIASVAYVIKMASISLVLLTSSRWRRYRQCRIRQQDIDAIQRNFPQLVVQNFHIQTAYIKGSCGTFEVEF